VIVSPTNYSHDAKDIYEKQEHEINFISDMGAIYSGFLLEMLNKQYFYFVFYR